MLLAAGCATALDKAKSAHTAREYQEAETLYLEAIEEPKTKADGRAGLAAMFVERAGDAESSDPKAAEADYRRALEIDHAHDQALTGIVRLLRKQKRMPDAAQVLRESKAAGECKPCERLEVVVLLDRAQKEVAGSLWDLAIVHFAMAQEIRPSGAVAVSIANAQVAKGTPAEALTTLEQALPLMAAADQPTVAAFVATRQQVFESSLADRQLELTDRARAIRLPSEDPQLELGLAIRTADTVANGDVNGAVVRYEAILARPDAPLTAEARADLRGKVARIYANRGTARLQAGAGDEADAAFAKAIEADPDDWSIKLQRIVAISEQTGARPGLQSLERVPKSTLGLDHTRAILLSLRVREQVAEGDLLGARISLDAAQKANPELPEVHLAAATLLARTPVETLNRKERRLALGRTSLVEYPSEVLRYGEALAELQWVASRRATGNKSLFTAPWLEPAVVALERELKGTYPFESKFQTDPEPVLVLQNTGVGFLEVTVKTPDGETRDLGLAGGSERVLKLSEAGLVRLKIGRAKSVFVAEGYARVTLTLP